jgi:uncharacterized SAM-binding protein YcdF (DUF218 family)
MLGVKKFITAFLLPPGFVILVLLALALWQLRRRRWLAGLLTGASALLLWSMSTAPVADRLTLGLERPFTAPARPAGDVIILLGGGVIEGVRDLDGTGAPTPDMLSRVVGAVRLYKRLPRPIIVSGGAVAEYRSSPEAPIDGRFLVDLGVPAHQVILEDKSRDTVENAVHSARICAARGFRHPILVTSAYHLRRAVIAFRKQGLEVQPYPASFVTWPGKRYGWVHYMPSAGALAQASTALREYIGILFYALTM